MNPNDPLTPLGVSDDSNHGLPESSSTHLDDVRQASGAMQENGLRKLAVDQPYSIASHGGWQSFELMPPTYRVNRDAKTVFMHWCTVVVVLLSMTIGATLSLWFKRQRVIERNQQLTAEAIPLRKLRTHAQLLEKENEISERWIGWVQSARPDDSLLQVVASVAMATHIDSQSEVDEHLNVQAIDVKLPLEYAGGANQPPSWAEPSFSVSAVARKRESVMKWYERLERLSRISDVKLNAPSGLWQEAHVHVNAVPLSTRIVP